MTNYEESLTSKTKLENGRLFAFLSYWGELNR